MSIRIMNKNESNFFFNFNFFNLLSLLFPKIQLLLSELTIKLLLQLIITTEIRI